MVAGALSTAFAFACAVPQAVRLLRVRRAAGVSVAALANSTLCGIAWMTYGAVIHDPWVVMPALVGLPVTATSLVLAWCRGGSRSQLWLPCAWFATIATAACVAPWAGAVPITAVLGCSIALLITPAAITAWRSHDVSALVASSWMLLITDAVIAGTYGCLAHVTANLLYAAVAVAGSLVILVRLALPAHVYGRLVHRTGRPPVPVVP
ncbi:sugar efflux transporter for intercellular exchange [Oryzihumus leptocrescens]|uniref:Sugar efflux transporter for intercellular exchange n=2 Tax=Oryzihumus leptocrescens TaxID=297536 RepID=A0A542ZFC2_9MICO|nr:sugar efflux transporter for intercellular exchange [Oryzihumus leptocrescens]